MDTSSATPPAERDRPTVVVTGQSGLIGSRLVRALRSDHRVAGLDVKPGREALAERFFECDLTDERSVERALQDLHARFGERIASVVHLAAYYDFAGEPSPLYDELTVEGTRRLLRGLRRFEVEQFVFSSSLLVMAPSEDGQPLNEGGPVRAEWEYPRSKLDAEAVIRAERHGIPAVVLRIAGVYDEDCHSIPIAEQIARIRERKLESHFFPGDQDHGQAFVHLDDLVDCIHRVIERRAGLGDHEVFLVAEPDVMSYAELQDVIGRHLHGKAWSTWRVPRPLAKAAAWTKDKLGQDDFIKPWMIDLADAHYPVSITKARRELGFDPRHRLRDTLPEILRRLQRDPEGWYRENGLGDVNAG